MRIAAALIALTLAVPALSASRATRVRTFASTSDHLSTTELNVINQITRIACWVRPSNATADMTIAWTGDSGVNDKHYHRLIAAGAQTGDPIRCETQDGGGAPDQADTTGSFSAGSWQHASHYVDLSTAGNNFVTLDGAFDGGSAPSASPSGIDTFSIGSAQDSTPDAAFVGELGECLSLSANSYATDTDAERRRVVRELSAGLMVEFIGPRRSTSSTARGLGSPFAGGGVASDAWPLDGASSPEPTLHSTGHSLTVTGTSTTTGAGPPVFHLSSGQ